MSIAWLWKNKVIKISQFLLVLVLITVWIFSGWPQIWQKPPFPPKIQEAKAATVTLLPNAAGTDTNWTYVGGALDYTNLQTDDGDTTYAYLPSGNNVDHTVNIDDTALTGTINSVTVYVVGRHFDATDDHQIKVKMAAVDYLAPSEYSPTATYVTYSWVMTTSPVSGAAWTWSEVNGLEVGVETDVFDGQLKKINSVGDGLLILNFR